MSAFLVEDKTINKVVTKLAMDRDGEWLRRMLKEKGYNLENLAGKQKLGWDMFGLNIRAVNMRYKGGQAEDFRPLNYKYAIECNYSRINALKSLQCWIYQCSEGDCDQSDFYKMFNDIQLAWCKEIIRAIPEYDKADWG